MDRERLLDLISGQLDGELSEAEQTELRTELEGSDTARNLLEAHRAQASLLKALEAPKASLELKEKLQKRLPAHGPSGSGWRHWGWMMAAVAASFCFLWGGQALQKSSSRPGEFYLQRGLISARPNTDFHSVVLQPGSNESEVFLSEPAVGRWTEGPVLVKFRGDGGPNPGQSVKVRLYIDLDGDQVWDLVEESEPLELDALRGHQEFSVTLPITNNAQVGLPVRGQVKLELIGESMSPEGMHILFHPEDPHLLLPLSEGAVKL